MGIRETLNKNPAITTGATIAIILVALGFIVYQLLPNRGPRIPTKAYFSTDDGTTWFADDIKKIPPYDKDGKDAVQCIVFKCNKTTFVGYLQKYDAAGKAAMEKSQQAGGPPDMAMDPQNDLMVKKPGDAKWVKMSDPKAATVTQVQCPDDPNAQLEIVMP